MKIIQYVATGVLLLAAHRASAMQILWQQGTSSVSVPFTLSTEGAVTVVASFKGDAGSIGFSQVALTARLDGENFITDGGRTSLTWQNDSERDLGQADTFRRPLVSAGSHTVSLSGTIQNVQGIRCSLLVILENEPEIGGGGGGEDLHQQIDDLLSSLNQEIGDRQAGDAILQEHLDALQIALEGHIAQIEAAVAALQSQGNANAQELAQLRSDLEGSLAGLRTVLETRIAQLETRVDALEQQEEPGDPSPSLNPSQEQLTALQNGLVFLDAKIASLKKRTGTNIGTYLIPAGIAVGGSIFVNAVWPRGGTDEKVPRPEQP